ncbi:hypothetical protein BD309DRAFT_436916 [Dichomitus squalens]|uniref:Uncharacterized protein n=1 Tax=Dichomitus squalens TaxID=114155 RepID=A0A4Q9P3N6_9APHY|nr:hypothetical protein BD311DRAFT_228780 [Dichomitus squalens]TBU47737.1 hypothetical protein BD309DRAFT_436916 [Dichomitus squalens]
MSSISRNVVKLCVSAARPCHQQQPCLVYRWSLQPCDCGRDFQSLSLPSHLTYKVFKAPYPASLHGCVFLTATLAQPWININQTCARLGQQGHHLCHGGVEKSATQRNAGQMVSNLRLSERSWPVHRKQRCSPMEFGHYRPRGQTGPLKLGGPVASTEKLLVSLSAALAFG